MVVFLVFVFEIFWSWFLCTLLIYFYLIILGWERKEKREKKHQFAAPLTCAFIGWFLCVLTGVQSHNCVVSVWCSIQMDYLARAILYSYSSFNSVHLMQLLARYTIFISRVFSPISTKRNFINGFLWDVVAEGTVGVIIIGSLMTYRFLNFSFLIFSPHCSWKNASFFYHLKVCAL